MLPLQIVEMVVFPKQCQLHAAGRCNRKMLGSESMINFIPMQRVFTYFQSKASETQAF